MSYRGYGAGSAQHGVDVTAECANLRDHCVLLRGTVTQGRNPPVHAVPSKFELLLELSRILGSTHSYTAVVRLGLDNIVNGWSGAKGSILAKLQVESF
eukprot:201758-Amphidinium_carterae.1